MPTTRTEQIETFAGRARLRLSDLYVTLTCVIRVYQKYSDDVPTLKHASGRFEGLPEGDATRAILDGKPLDLELEDGRKAKIFITDTHGSFRVSGPLE